MVGILLQSDMPERPLPTHAKHNQQGNGLGKDAVDSPTDDYSAAPGETVLTLKSIAAQCLQDSDT